MKDIKKRLKALEEEFEQLKKTREGLVEEAKKLQQNLTEVDNQIVMKQGAYQELKQIDDENSKTKKGDSDNKKKEGKEKTI